MRLADRLGLPEQTRSSLFYAALLKDSGCSSNAAAITELFGMDDQALKGRQATAGRSLLEMARFTIANLPQEPLPLRARRLITLAISGQQAHRAVEQLRCSRGAGIAKKIGFAADVSEAIMDLHEHWDGRGLPQGLHREGIPLASRVIAVCAGLDVFTTDRGPVAAAGIIRRRRGSWYDPALTDHLLELCKLGALDELHAPDLKAQVFALEPSGLVQVATDVDIDRIASAFAEIIDAKSPFTGRHSLNVAAIAEGLTGRFGLSADARLDVRRAALLHDIGKLGVPNKILDKPGPLDAAEFAIIKRHPELSLRILEPVEVFANVAQIAASHHEKLDGTGYFRGLGREALGLSARIVSVSDVFEAMTADRPYRAPMTPEEALALMRKTAGNHLAAEVINALAQADTFELAA
ncbi:MAG: HD domain-containing protein [Candidatus Dormibacteraeota bacterium]|nr:HD domain-containing protein [Candidatus Dormibacteraeota bacterium]